MRNKFIISLLAAGLSMITATNATAAVKVTFDNPVNFTDVPRSIVDRERMLEQLQTHIQQLAERLPADSDLQIDVLDINLAGRNEPFWHPTRSDLRVVRDTGDAPRMQVRYTLTNGSQVAQRGEDQLIDMSYMARSNRYDAGDPLRFEKKMIDDWFTSRFLAR